MSVKDDDAALLTQGKEEDADRRKIDRKDGLVFKLSDYKTKTGIFCLEDACLSGMVLFYEVSLG